jgi:acyl-CoA dehydrogenase
MDFDLTGRSEVWRARLQAFFDQEVLPRHRAWLEHSALHRKTAPFMGELQRKARAAGLWNLGLPELSPDEPGTRLSNLDMRHQPRSWDGCSGLLKFSTARRPTFPT